MASKQELLSGTRRALPPDMAGLGSSALGSLSGGFGFGLLGRRDDCEGVSLALLLTAFACIAVTFFAVFTKLTTIIANKRRRRRSSSSSSSSSHEDGGVLDNLHLIVHEGTSAERPLGDRVGT